MKSLIESFAEMLEKGNFEVILTNESRDKGLELVEFTPEIR